MGEILQKKGGGGADEDIEDGGRGVALGKEVLGIRKGEKRGGGGERFISHRFHHATYRCKSFQKKICFY